MAYPSHAPVIPWETAVTVHALTMRVVAYRDEAGTCRFKVPQASDVPWFEATAEGDWPGVPIDTEWAEPQGPMFVVEPVVNGRTIVRLRRFLLTPPLPGIVIGDTWRWEGVLADAEPGEWTPGGGMAGPKRKLVLHEVSLPPQGRSAKSLVVFVHPRDMTTRDVVTLNPGVAAAPSRAVTGRLGGR